MKKVLLKRPGLQAIEKQVSTEDDKLRFEVGCDYQTVQFQPHEPIYLLSAQRETAIGRNLPHNVWRYPDGALYGNVIAIRKNDENGRYESLQPEDIERLQYYFSEHSFHEFSQADPQLGSLSDRDSRRSYHGDNAFFALDDLNVVLRRHAELEAVLREKLVATIYRPSALDDVKPRFTYDQVVSLLFALGTINARTADLLKRMGTIRNKFAHDPAYMLSAKEAHKLREDAFGFGDEESSIPLIKEYCYERGLELTEESAVLRALYAEVFGWLNSELPET